MEENTVFDISGLPDDARVDPDAGVAGVIFGARAMEYGPLKEGDARPYFVDDTTLKQVEAMINRNPSGLKMRFSHSSGIDAHLGKARNAAVNGMGDGAFVSVDATMSRSSTSTPNGNLAKYVLDLAKETPEDFGLSVAGTKFDRQAMKAGKRSDGLLPIRFKGLKAVDFGSDTAATSGLFEVNDGDPCTFADHAEWLVETHDLSREELETQIQAFVTTHFAEGENDMSDSEKDTRIAELEAEVAKFSTDGTDGGTDGDGDDSGDEAAKARETLKGRAKMTAFCKLAKVDEETQNLLMTAEFTVTEAQSFLKDCGHLSAINPAIDEGSLDLDQKKKTPEDEFAAEFEQFADVYARQGVSKEDFIASRMIDAN